MARTQPEKTSIIFLFIVGLVIAAGTAVFLSRNAEAQAPTPISSCVDVSGSVILTADITDTSRGYCLKVVGDNTTIDGNGHHITVTGGSSAWAIYNTNHTHLSVMNVVSNNDVYIYNDADFATIQDSTFGYVYVTGADDATVKNNTLGAFAVDDLGTNIAYRAHVTNNTISSNGHTLVSMIGSDHVFSNNTLTSSYQCISCDEPKVLFLRAGTGNVVSGNMIHSLYDAMPVRMRDGWDNSTFTNNTVWASSTIGGAFSAFNMTSGIQPPDYPGGNTITHNSIRADQDNAFYIEASDLGNTFSYNTIVGNTGGNIGTFGFGATGATFNHNTLYNTGAGGIFQFASRSSSNVNTFRNNILSYAGSSAYGFDCTAQDCPATYYTADYNLYQNRSGAASFGTYGANLAALKSTMAPDDAHSIEANPQFADAANRDFSLNGGSPAINTASDGTNIGAWQTGQCTESWSCGAWSACSNGTQTRTCTDNNSCGTTAQRPITSQTCVVPDTSAPAPVTDFIAF